MPEINIIGNASFGQPESGDTDSILRNIVRSMQLDPSIIASANQLRGSPIPNISRAVFGRGGGPETGGNAAIQAITQSLGTLSTTNEAVTNSLSTMVQELRQVISLLGGIQNNTAQQTREKRAERRQHYKDRRPAAEVPHFPGEAYHMTLDLPPGSMIPPMRYDQYSRATRSSDANIRRWTEGPSRRGINYEAMGSMETALAIINTTGGLVGGMPRPSMRGGPNWNPGGRIIDQYPTMLGGPRQKRLEAPYSFPFEEHFGPYFADRGTRDAYAWDPTKRLGGPPPPGPTRGLGGRVPPTITYSGPSGPPGFGGGVTYGGPPGTGGGGMGIPPFPFGWRRGGGGPPPTGPTTWFGGMPGTTPGGPPPPGVPGTWAGVSRLAGIAAAPILISKGMQAWSNLAQESDRYVQVTSQLARGMTNTTDRQAGYNTLADRTFNHFLGGMGWGTEPQPTWLSKLGLTPLEAAQLARTYPVAPRNQSEADLISAARGRIPFTRGMGQLNPGTADALVMQGGMYGIGSPNDYVSGLDASMSHAIMNQMPTEGLAQGIMGTNDILASMGGGNLNANQIENFNTGMQDVGLAGSRTGVIGQQVLQSVAGGFAQAFAGNAPAANTLGNLILDIKSNSDLASKMGMSDEEFQRKMASADKADKPFQDMINKFWQAKREGRIPQAGSYLQAAAGFGGMVNPNLMMVNESRDILLRQGFKESDVNFPFLQAAGAGLVTTPGGITPIQQMEIIQQGIPTTPTGGRRVSGGGANAPTRDLNPASIMYGDQAVRLGAIGKDESSGLAKFPTAQAGMAAQESMLFGSGYGNLTISRAMKRWVTGNPDAPAPPGSSLSNYVSMVLAANNGQDVVVSTLDPTHRQAVMEAQRRAEGWQGGGELIDPRQAGINQRQNEAGTAATEGARYAAETWNISLGQLDQVFKEASSKIENIMANLGPAFQHASGP